MDKPSFLAGFLSATKILKNGKDNDDDTRAEAMIQLVEAVGSGDRVIGYERATQLAHYAAAASQADAAWVLHRYAEELMSGLFAEPA